MFTCACMCKQGFTPSFSWIAIIHVNTCFFINKIVREYAALFSVGFRNWKILICILREFPFNFSWELYNDNSLEIESPWLQCNSGQHIRISPRRYWFYSYSGTTGSPWPRSHRHLTENYLRLWVWSPAAQASNFSTTDCKKINKALSVRVIVICSDRHKLLWCDSYKGVGCVSTFPEYILHKIIIIIIITLT